MIKPKESPNKRLVKEKRLKNPPTPAKKELPPVPEGDILRISSRKSTPILKRPKRMPTRRPEDIAIPEENLERVLDAWKKRIQKGETLTEEIENIRTGIESISSVLDKEKRSRFLDLTLSVIDKKIKANNKNPYKMQELLVLRALTRKAKGELEGALKHLEAAYNKVDPETKERIVNPEVSHLYAMLLLENGDYEKALEPLKDYSKFVLDPREKEQVESLIKEIKDMLGISDETE